MGKKYSESLFGDARLDNAFRVLVARLVVRYSLVIRQLANNEGEERRFSRFINNSSVGPKSLVDQWNQLNDGEVKGKNILVISDSSTLSFPPNMKREELGYVGVKTNKSGFEVHPSLVLDADEGSCYGLGGIHVHKTPFSQINAEASEKKKRRMEQRKLPFEQKKKYKWLDSPKQAIKNFPHAASYTLVADRDADVYDLIKQTLEHGWDFVYRSSTNRHLSGDHENLKLHGQLNSWPIQHSYELVLAATKDRSAHKGLMELKFGQLSIKRPRDKAVTLPEQIPLYVVEVKENPKTVVEDEKAVHWILLSSHPVDNYQQALQIIQWYTWRWVIEQLFRTLKKEGLKIEGSQVKSFNGLANLATMGLLAACQIMQLVQARHGGTKQKVDHVFSPIEIDCLNKLNDKLQGKTEKLKNPHDTNDLAYVSWIIGRLGGWSGYASRKPPGPITIINGLNRFYTILEGVILML